MPIHLFTEQDFRRVRDPGFCYLCGSSWEEDLPTNRDHVPPRRLFAEADRRPPLVLRTHVRCNNGHSLYDQQVGQLVSLIWKESPSPEDVSSLRISLHTPRGMAPFGAVEWLNLRFIIARWLKAFHTALYREFLPAVNGSIHEPFPGGDRAGEDTTLHISHPIFVREIKRNRAARRLDCIVAFKGRCRYECTWTHLDDGRPVCFWALDLYGWHRLGDINNFPARSCGGYYEALNGIPEGAAVATKLDLPFRNTQPLNAFEE